LIARSSKKKRSDQPGSRKHDLDALIKDGCGHDFGGDRSRAVWYVINRLLKRGDKPETIVATITDPANGISAHCLDQSDPNAYARRQVEKAQQEQQKEPGDDDAELTRLAKLSAIDYERARKEAAEKLDIRAPILDKLIASKRAELGLDADDGKQGSAISFPDPEPWPDPVDGAALLSEIADAARKHVVMANHDKDKAALWTVHTYLLDEFLISPRLAIRSPVPRCGKTTLLDVLTRLVHRPLPAANVSAAAAFRVIEGHRPCLLIDEADTFLRDNEELRGVLNSGHRRGGSVLRTVGEDHEPRSFATYSAAAIALIGQLPGTLADRSITIDLKRRLPSEKVEPFRLDRTEHLDKIARKIARWAADNAEAVRAADPEMPDGVFNREADNLRPLLAIADVAGGDWPERARKAIRHGREASDQASLLELLLSDIRDIFEASDHLDRIASATLVERLVQIESHPWGEFGRSGKPITPTKLARLLDAPSVKIGPQKIRFTTDDVRMGYYRHQFDDAFEHFLAPFSGKGGFEPEHRNKADATGTSDTFQTGTDDPDVPVRKSEKSNNGGQSSDVPVSKGGNGKDTCTTLDKAAIEVLAQRFNSLGYNDDELDETEALRRAEADLRRELVALLPVDRVETEYKRVWWRAVDLRAANGG
jgi:putative DNA primase/helicase